MEGMERATGQAVDWADVKANIVVKQAAPPVTSDPWEIYVASLMLVIVTWNATLLVSHLRV